MTAYLVLGLIALGIVAGVAANLLHFYHIVPYVVRHQGESGRHAVFTVREDTEAYFKLRPGMGWFRVLLAVMRLLFFVAWLMVGVLMFLVWKHLGR